MHLRRRWILAALLLTSVGAGACPLPLPELQLTLAGRQLTVEVARTPAAWRCGLSRRDRLAPDHGMLFAFHEPVLTGFWMKDTRIPLSIAFIDEDWRIIGMADMSPLDTRHRHRPATPYAYALEVRQGWFAQHGVEIGDRIRFGPPGAP